MWQAPKRKGFDDRRAMDLLRCEKRRRSLL
jgi:hypothetical protein